VDHDSPKNVEPTHACPWIASRSGRRFTHPRSRSSIEPLCEPRREAKAPRTWSPRNSVVDPGRVKARFHIPNVVSPFGSSPRERF
jgi:hypothetical protein